MTPGKPQKTKPADIEPRCAPIDGLRFRLPWPPSVNGYWRAVVIGGKVRQILSREARAYHKAAVLRLALQGVHRAGVNQRVRVFIEAAEPVGKRRRDLDNVLKAAIDAVVHGGVLQDDALIDRLEIRRMPFKVDKGELWVSVVNMDGGA